MGGYIGTQHKTVQYISQGRGNHPTQYVAFIVAGQSNSVGWVDFDNGEGYPVGALQYDRNNLVMQATVPLSHVGGTHVGDMGFAVQFAIEYIEANPTHEICFIPCGSGGTSFQNNQWGVGNELSDNVINRSNSFFSENPHYSLGAILWHQGESDHGNVNYQTQLDAQFLAFRSQIDAATSDTPIIVGPLVPSWVDKVSTALPINQTLKSIGERLHKTACISDVGLQSDKEEVGGTDDIHFGARSLRLMGRRYFQSLYVASNNIIPATEPEMVTGLIAQEGDSLVTLSWSEPSDGGSVITGYEVERSEDGITFEVVASGVEGLSYSDTTVTNGVEYTYRVSAVNSVGKGAYSDPVTATPESAVVPLAPELSATTGDATVTLLWSVPNDGGSAITGYEVERSEDGVNFNNIASDVVELTYADNTVTNGVTYYYRVRAINSIGAGAYSNTTTAIPDGVNLPEGAYAYFEMNDLTDTLGNITTATLHNQGSFVTDTERGQVLSCSSNSGIKLGSDFAFGDTGYTKTVWGYLTDFNGSSNIWSTGQNNINAGTVFWIDAGVLSASTNASGLKSAAYTLTSDQVVNQWKHYAVTYNATNGDLFIYLDGQLVGSDNVGAGANLIYTEDIGLYNGSNGFRGYLDDAIAWKRPLTAQEIQDVMSITSVTPSGSY